MLNNHHNLPPFALAPLTRATFDAVRYMTPARFAVITSALAVDLRTEDLKVVPPGATLADLAPVTGAPVVCVVDGQYIARDQWSTKARPGEIIIFQEVPQGGGGGGGSNPMRTLLMIAVIVASFYIPGALGLVAGTWQAALAGAAVNFVGMMLVNALVPPPKPTAGFESQSPSPTYSVSLGGNSARIDQPIPVGYGQCDQIPDFAGQPYSIYSNNEQLYHAVLGIGKGKYELLRTQIDDTDIRSFSDVELAYVGPGQQYATLADQALVDPAIVSAQEIAGQDLENPSFVGPFTLTGPGKTVNRVSVDMAMQMGLGNVGGDGSVSARSMQFELQIRELDDDDQPVNGWLSLGIETYTAATTTPQFITRSYDVTPARYQVRARRMDYKSDNSNHLNQLSWAAVRVRLVTGIELDANSTYVCVRIRASKQLSGMSQRRIGVVWKRHVQVWNGAAWTLQHTRNPAWALWDMLTNADYGKGLPASRVDLDTLYSLAQVWDARQDHFDHIYDTRTTIQEALQLAARSGRAVPLVRRGKWTFVRDAEQTLPVAMFSPRNIIKDSLSIEYSMPSEDTPDALRLSYRDGITHDEKVIISQLYAGQLYTYKSGNRPAGVPAPGKTTDFKMPGVVGQKHALREAAYLAATAFWRRTTVKWTSELDGLLPAYGSLVAVAHDVPGWGQHAEVSGFDAATLTLTTSQPLEWTANTTHFVRLMTRIGDVTSAIEVTRAGTDDTMILSSAPGFFVVDTESNPDLERTKLVFGPADNVGEMVRLKSIRPRGNGEIEMSGVVEDVRVHEADNAFLPVANEVQDAPPTGAYDPVDAVWRDPVLADVSFTWPAGVMQIDTVWSHRIEFTVRAAGTLFTDYEWFGLYGGVVVGQWLSPTPPTQAALQRLEMRWTGINYAYPPADGWTLATQGGDSPPYNTWVPLTVDHQFWLPPNSSSNYIQDELLIEIRRTDTFETVLTRQVNLYRGGAPA